MLQTGRCINKWVCPPKFPGALHAPDLLVPPPVLKLVYAHAAMLNGGTACLLDDNVVEVGLVDCFFRPLKLKILVSTGTAVRNTLQPLK